MDVDDTLRYPIGHFRMPESVSADDRLEYTKEIGALPERLEARIRELKARNLLDTPYRPGGWTAQQVIHHLADSHLHAYRRHKVTLVEDNPTLVPYDENSWAGLPDVMAVPVDASLDILRGLHLRWGVLLSQCAPKHWVRPAYHPGSGVHYRLETLAATYAWHGNHHLGHLDIILGDR